MILRSLASILCAASLFAPAAARAEDGPPQVSTTRPSAFQLELGPEIGITTATREGAGVGLGAALLFGVGSRWSVGASGSFLISSLGSTALASGRSALDPPRGNAMGLARLDAEGRYHLLLTRVVDTWIAADVGVGAPLGAGNSSAGPHVGLGAGIDLHPFPAMSVGVAARGNAFLLDLGSGGSYVYPSATVGVGLSFHLPSSSSAPAAPKVAAVAPR